MSKQNNENITEKVMAKIEKDEVKMKPKLYFILGSFLLGIGIVGISFLGTFLFNLILFRIKSYSVFGFLRFGPLGIQPFLESFPWLILALTVLSLYGAIKLLQKYDTSYRQNLLGISLLLIGIIALFGSLINVLGFNEKIETHSLAKTFYYQETKNKNWIVGKVINIQESRFEILTPGGRNIEAMFREEIISPPNFELEEETHIKALGDWQEEVFMVKAIDLHQAPPNNKSFQKMPGASVKGKMVKRSR